MRIATLIYCEMWCDTSSNICYANYPPSPTGEGKVIRRFYKKIAIDD